jgi:ABC-2 type transport system ATP-binding protein
VSVRAPAIELRGLRKTYGAAHALDGVDLTVPEGSVFGFLGPNGAGKTTTLRILTGLARATAGEARVFGVDVADAGNDIRARIGFLPDVPGFYDWMTAEEFLRFAGSLFGVTGSTLDERVAALLDLAGLNDVSTKVGGYSRGMK